MTEQRTIVITGASHGIGAASARQLAATGARVVLVGRESEETAAVANEIDAPYHAADFTDLSQVNRLADELLAAYPRIDVLANNAGGLFKHDTTKDGFEKTVQVNYLAPFLLTTRLVDRLIESEASLIQTASIGHRMYGNLDLDDLNNEKKWSATKAYGDSKVALILFSMELHRRYHARGINTVAFHPGNVSTSFGTDTALLFRLFYRSPIVQRLLLISADKGGAALTRFIDGTPGVTWQSGEYYEDNKIAPAKKRNPQIDDKTLGRQLWERSEALLGISAA
ncbi:SDR family NAD(P)-dependent oxidoreductase [Cryptosporangium aurantiacum]|uniref:Short-chain dehydrogenase n=1 Tax=Cryptosporangium aurantiacum TaxID=134849 RepID=A0A1M7R3R2_9ACTN|nr:SDR family NAD(P)-dependent oxidoreductase [Cryptosporangium aurantiacum]SHN39726.1 Short-chain dehydrogenase [Cryptosporangium aurantiacum]